MSNRFLHDQFKQILPCSHCDGRGEIEGKAEGFSDHGIFILTGFTDANGREITLTEDQKKIIEIRGSERVTQVEAENREHRAELNRDLRAEIRCSI